MNNREIATEMVKKMRLKGFSQKTVKAYMGHIRRLAQYYKTCVAALSSAQIEEYLLQQLNDGGRAASYINQCTAAFKFLYRDVLDSKEVVVNLPRMKKERILPDILTKEEVFRIISGVKNPKHRAMLVVTYSAGLRVGETVRLTIKDIDSQRMLIHVGQGKGRKDRYSVLSKKALKVLRDYARLYRPKGWLFEGQNPGQHITKRSLQRVFEEACKHSGITKDVSIHGLRHAFCTHLLENGTDIRFIQEIVGHSSPKTTELYLHVSTRHIGCIQSPLDRMFHEDTGNKD